MTPLQLCLYGFGLTCPLTLFIFFSLDVPLAPTPELGERGAARAKARRMGFFGPFENALRLAATHMSKLPIQQKRKDIDESLRNAGEMRGFTPDEFLVVSVIGGIFGITSAWYFYYATTSTLLPLFLLFIGPVMPTLQLRSLRKQRHKMVDRGLPAAIDLAALCMSAGSDFYGAFQHVVANMPDPDHPVRKELERVLQELSLGHTRKKALHGLAKRVPTHSVKEFVGALTQAEEKGSPIAEVLSVQASSLRGKRSVMAEEAAARAGVMFMLPMMMVMASILLILLGPLLIEMSQGGF